MNLIPQISTIFLTVGLGGAFWVPIIVIVFIAILLLLYSRHLLNIKKAEIERLNNLLQECKAELQKLEELKRLIPELKQIARLDHDVNTPLCVITMSLGRAKKIATTTDDQSLLTNVEDILEAVGRIGEIMQIVRVLKTSTLISYKE